MKVYSTGQLVFGHDLIIPIKHTVNWELIHQQNKTQINKDITRKNKNRVNHDCKVGDKVKINIHSSYDYLIPF